MRNCNAGEILSDYANVLAEIDTCLQEADEDREFARMYDVSSHAEASISFFSLFYRSICISIRHRFILTWISEKLPPGSSCGEKRVTLENR